MLGQLLIHRTDCPSKIYVWETLKYVYRNQLKTLLQHLAHTANGVVKADCQEEFELIGQDIIEARICASVFKE